MPALKSLCENKSNAQTAANGGNGGSNGGSGNASVSSPVGVGANVLQFDYNVVVAVLKSSKYPESTKNIVSASSSAATGNNANDKDWPKSEIKRSRSDLSSIIIQQLTAPLEAGKITWAPLSEELTDCSVSSDI